MFKRILKYCILIIAGVILAVAMLEFGVRILGAKPETYLRKFSEYHPILGWVKTPNMEGEFIRGDIRIREKMNSKGLRDIEYDYTKPINVKRILVLGDSFTEGYDVDFENIFTEILERTLNDSLSVKTGFTYEVINAGTGGYSTDQEFLFYKTEGYKYNPDIVLLMAYAANDVYYNNEPKYGNYYKPVFVAENDSLRTINTPLPRPNKNESFKDLFRDMALYPIITKIVLAQFPTLAEKLSRLGFISQSTLEIATAKTTDSNGKKFPASFAVFSRRMTDKMVQAWKITDLLIRDLAALSKSNGSTLLLFSIPDRFQISTESWATTKIQYNVNDSIWDPNTPDVILDSVTAKYDIPFMNFSNYVRQGSARHERLYNGVHWNVRGNEVAAKFIFQELVTKGWIGK